MPSLWFDVNAVPLSLSSRVELWFTSYKNLVNSWSALRIFNRCNDVVYVVFEFCNWSKLGDVNCYEDEARLSTLSGFS